MAELRDGEQYSIPCGEGPKGISVMHVRLTETAFRALESYQSSQGSVSSQPSINFQGSQGLIKIPKVDQPNEMHEFNFYMSNVGNDNAQGSFDCIKQTVSSSGASQLSFLGPIQNKITVCATSDSYQTTRERMTQAEEESRNHSTKVIKPHGPLLGRTVQRRKAPQCSTDMVPKRKRSTPTNPAELVRRNHNAVSQRPYRDRVIHLLALRSYKKPELLARLQRDGVHQKDRNSLGYILQQVATLSPKDNSYSLKDYVFKEIQKDWPGYSEIDKQSLELILSRKSEMLQDAASTSIFKPPLTANRSTPSTSQQRISRLSTRPPTPLFSCHLSGSREKASATATAPPPPPHPSAAAGAPTPPPVPSIIPSVSNPLQTAGSTSHFTPEEQGAQDLLQGSWSTNSNIEFQQQRYTSEAYLRTLMPPPATPPNHMGKRQAAFHQRLKRMRERVRKVGSTTQVKYKSTASKSKEGKDLGKEETDQMEEGPSFNCLHALLSKVDVHHVLDMKWHVSSFLSIRKYVSISSEEQRQSYKDDFNAEYDEYRDLHFRVECVTQKFTKLDSQRKEVSPNSKEYQVLHEEILEEYQKLKQSIPNYFEEKHRCMYLHNKLSHIKKLIGEF
ncbi:ELL2 factor, partial [Turnix velox]|nr:ELL2 factor [Turnix velox]